MPTDITEPTPEMIAFYEERTRAHIERVRRCLSLLTDVTPFGAELLERGRVHDASKYGPEERIPYIWLTEHHRRRRRGEPFAYPPGVAESVRRAVEHHLTTNRHHPEFHARPDDMSPVDLAEMVCDWTAMAQEFEQDGGSARGWADKTLGTRLALDAANTAFVYELIALVDRQFASQPKVESMGSLRSIAVAQTCPLAGDVAANTEEHLRLARAAAGEGARVVVFPELSLTGYELALARASAFAEDDARLRPLRQAARELSATLIVGAPVKIGPLLHIGAFILLPDGSLDLYTKQRMGAFPPEACCDGVVPPAEATVFSPGDRNPLVDLDGSPAAIAVCADVGRPIHPEQAAARGAKAYLASMFVIPSEFAGEAAKLSGYAAKYAMRVAMANYGAPTGGLAAAGRSTIWSATGDLLVQLDAAGSGVGIVTGTPHDVRTRIVRMEG